MLAKRASLILNARARLWAVLCVLAAFTFALPGFSQVGIVEDPLPIRRVQVPASRLAAELEQARAGILVPLSRADFEKRVRLAGKVRQELPRLLKASYSATVGENALVNGRGEWTVQFQGASPALLPLADFNLALSQLRDANNQDAILASFDEKSLGLVIDKVDSDKAGSAKFYFDWTLRGIPSASGQLFAMHVPPCAAASLELRLAPGQLLAVSPKIAMLSGPHESESPKHRLWRLHFTGQSQIEFVVKNEADPNGKALVLTSMQCRQQLQPGRCRSDFEYQFEVLHGHVDQLTLACDSDLEPYEVTLKSSEPKGWEIREAPAKGKKLLIISLREPVQGALSGLAVRCFSPLKANQRWTSPGLYVQHAVTRGETIELTLHPEVQLQGWQPGQFQLSRSSINPDGAQVLVLARSGVDRRDQADASTRPTGTARYGGVEFLAKQKSWWHVGPRTAALTTEIVYEIHRGSLFQLALNLPKPSADWQVEAVQLNPGKKTPNWLMAGGRLLISLDTPLTPADDARLRVRLRSQSPRTWPAGGATVPFADLAPVEPCLHAGELGISIDPTLEGRVLHTTLAVSPVEAHGPWGKNALDFHFSHRQQPVSGMLQVQSRPSRLDAQVVTDAALSGAQAAWRTKLLLEPRAGLLSSIDLAISGTGLHGLRLQSGMNAVRGLSRQPIAEALPELLSLGSRGGFEQALLGLALPRGQRWRIELAEPLEQLAEINLEATLEPAAADKDHLAWEVPLVTVLGDERREMQVSIRTLNKEAIQQESLGLKYDGLPSGGQTKLTMHGDGTPFPSLRVLTRPQAAVLQGLAEAGERALLLSEWQPDGTLVHHFRFELLNWGKPSMPIALPSGTRQVLGVRVDGCWLDTIPHEAGVDGMRVELPVPSDGFRHTFEIVYLGPDVRATWSLGDYLLGGSLPAPMPKLPIPVTALQRRWRLPADLVPLHGAAIREVGDHCAGDCYLPGVAPVRRLWQVGNPLFRNWGIAPGMTSRETQRELLAGADVALQKKAIKPRQLGEFLQELSQELGVNNPLVLDTSALTVAGLDARTLVVPPAPGKSDVRIPIWEQAGLIIVRCRSALLVTTRVWFDSLADRASPASAVEDFAQFVEESLSHGQDGSGRFRTLADWLRTPSHAADQSAGPDGRVLRSGRTPGYTEWEPVPGQPHADELVVIRRPFLTAWGIVLALAMFLAARLLSQRFDGAWCFRLWLAWVSFALLGWIWLPSPFGILAAWMLLSAAALGVVSWLGKRLSKGTIKSASSIRTSAALILLAAGSWLTALSPARSGGDEPFTVLLLPSKSGAAAQDVLVPQELLKRLDRLADGASPFRGAVVLTGARYRGAVLGATADVKAEFSCFSFADKGQLLVPLDGVDLQPGAFLDGVPVYPVVAQAPRSGYLIPVQGRGAHQLSLSFTARVAQAGSNQQLRFQIPRLAQSQLAELLLPTSAQSAQVIGALGSQTLARSGNDWSLKAQIGPQQIFDVRWRSTTSKPGPSAQVEVRELYYWDLRLPLPSLTGILKYSIAKGQVSTFAISMPDELEVRSVEFTAGPLAEISPGLKSWHVRGGKDKRTLTVELLVPIAGEVQLKLGMAPHVAVRPGNVALPLPYPLQIKPAGFQEGFLAYRVAGVEARENPKDLGIIGIEPATFMKEWRRVAASADVQPTRAVNFRRSSPKANLGLSLLGPSASASQEITWDVQPFHADLTAVCEINTVAGDLMLVEWQVPPAVVLADIYGPHVHSWSRQDSLVQVWLAQPQKETRVTLWGWVRHTVPLLPGKAGNMSLPRVSLRQPTPTSTVVRIQPEHSLKLEASQLQGLRPLRSDESSRALLYAPSGPPGSAYDASVRLAHAPVPPAYRTLTVMRARGDRIAIAADLVVQVSPRNAVLHVQAKGWPDDVQLGVPESLPPPQRHKGDTGPSWTVQLRPGLPARIPLRLHAETSLSRTADIAMPGVTIVGGTAQERWFGVLGSELVVSAEANVKPTTDFVSSLAGWPERAKQFQGEGSLWKALADDWRLAVKARATLTEPSVRVVAVEHESALAPDGRWLHEARFELFSHAGGDVRFALPGTSVLQATQLDGVPILPSHEGKYWRVALPRLATSRVLRVRWQYAAGDETIDAPNLATPTLSGMGQVKVAGAVWLPAGFRTGALTQGQPLSAAQWMLERARAQFQIGVLLAEKRKDVDSGSWEQAMRQSQARFYWCCRQAEQMTSRATSTEMDAGGNVGLAEALRQLQLENARLAEKHQFVKMQKNAAKTASLREPEPTDNASALTKIGITRYWHGEAERPPLLRLVTHASEQYRRRLLITQGVVLAFVGLLILSFLPAVAHLGQALWPEHLVLFAVAGWLLFGPSLFGAALVLLGFILRGILLARMGQRWLSRRAEHVGGGSSVHPSGA